MNYSKVTPTGVIKISTRDLFYDKRAKIFYITTAKLRRLTALHIPEQFWVVSSKTGKQLKFDFKESLCQSNNGKVHFFSYTADYQRRENFFMLSILTSREHRYKIIRDAGY